ncbi:hypothetical protein Fmac_017971 [Flemingia macrophylla]|uniref:Uncharacterized protein n=1 Tax=Flemingia macrophylla TaxID=520843 RepID=A0ABD1M3L0_9FABA
MIGLKEKAPTNFMPVAAVRRGGGKFFRMTGLKGHVMMRAFIVLTSEEGGSCSDQCDIGSDACTTTLTHTIDGRRGSIYRRGGNLGIGSPIRSTTALWLLYFSSSFLCNSLDQTSLVISRPSRLAYNRKDSKR